MDFFTDPYFDSKRFSFGAAQLTADCVYHRFRAATVRERAGVVPHVPHCDVTVLVAEAVFPAASYAMTLIV